ncbi:PD-(D/E)XK nuclease family protein [Cellulomonas dongxiuzhuiae]|uniref:PD-(D/E)XK nuclease family protein n=1 Tax=Cellulomonas dongxiuzhuiae TaxID=2819979 RepID=A0ABX8GPT5_9CELL|nr:PD-(D/E)XK nuclease family protein [Cellulomonas dongxiuzhuiae]QWC17878.1 PD-(D/E)XK nuclease family protein [Cellulomonas dongxiuzhuiae]
MDGSASASTPAASNGGTGEVGAPPTEPRVPGLSPSRANDYLQCPLLYRFRVVDRLPEPASPAAARGTLVHAVLERLFDLPAAERTLEAACAALPERWAEQLEQDPRCADLHTTDAERAEFLAGAERLLATWFTLEDPTRIEPRARELQVLHDLEDGPRLRGVVDRVDVAPNGWVRVVDYKTGRSPRAGFESSALFQMRFYAYVVWRSRGVLPKRLQLAYLGDGVVVTHEPTESEMHTLEARVRSIWAGIEDTARSGDWRPRPSRLCDWCSFRDRCPSFGGTPPPVPEGAVQRAIGVTPAPAA